MEVIRNGFGSIIYYIDNSGEESDLRNKLRANQSRFLNDLKNNNLIYKGSLCKLHETKDFSERERCSYITCVDYNGNTYSVLLYGIIGKLKEKLGLHSSTYFTDVITKLDCSIYRNFGLDFDVYYKTIKNMQEGYGINEFKYISCKVMEEKKRKEEEARKKKEEARKRFEERQRAENEAFKLSLVNRFNPNMSINDFIIKVKNPCIERELGNNNKNTFDFITLEMLTPLKFYGDRKKYINDHIKEIYKIAMDKIGNYKYYQKYGVPVNYLKLTNLTLSCENTLVFKFGIKGETKEAG